MYTSAVRAAGGGVSLSDDDPLATSTSADSGSGGEASRDDHIHVGLVVTDLAPEDADGTAADAGTSPQAARADHIHEVPSATTSVEGISERATGDEARAGTDTSRHMTPQRVSQVFTDRAGDATPEDVGTADTGTATNFSREDHVHGGGTGGGGGPDLYDTIPPSIGEDGSAGTSADASRGDHTHGGQRAVSDNTPEDIGTAAPGSHAAASRSDHVHGGTVTTTDATLSDADPEDTGTTAPGTSDDVSRSDHVHESAGGGGGGAGLSDIAAEGVTETPSAGTGTDASRWDHEHDIPFNNTLEWDSNAQFGVRVEDVIEHLQEHIQYHTASGDYSSSGGATVGQVYATSAYRKLITKVEVLLNPLVGADGFLVRLDELNADNSIKAKLFTSQTRSAPFGLGVAPRAFTFHDADGDLGVPIDPSIRLGILISRLGDNSDSAVAAVHGTEVSFGPRKSYDDASVDFELENDVVYEHINPGVGQSTHSHGTDIRGNIKIFYTLIVDHGNLVGDGNINAAHIDSETADDGWVLTADGAGGSAWEAATGGGGASDTETDLFLAPIEAAAVGGLSTSGVNRLILTEANAIVNRGGFTVEAAAANQAIAVPVDGTYAIDFTLYMQDSTAATRSEIRAEIVILRGSAEEAALRTPFTRYYRDNVANDEFYISGAITMDLLAADEIQLLISEMANSSATFSSGANNSKISVARLAGGGSTGAQLSGGLTEQVIVGSRLATTEYGLGNTLDGGGRRHQPNNQPSD